MKKVLIKFSFILLFFLLLGTTYAEDIENGNSTSKTNQNTTIESEDLDMFFCDGSSFQIKLTGEDVSNKIVTMNIHGVNYYTQTNKEGVASLPIRLNPNQYEMITSYEHLTNKNIITVHKTKTSLETQDSLNLVYRNGYYSVILKDQNKIPIPGEIVNINVNGITYPAITNKEGIATLPINLYPGTYKVTSTFLESYNKQYSSISSTINIFPKEQCRIIADNYECEYENGEYSIKVLGENNSPIQYGEIEIRINGVTYTKTTDKNGIATLHIGLYPGRYPVSYKFGSLNGYKTITVHPLICQVKSIDVNASYNDYSYYSIELTKNGSYLENKLIRTEAYLNKQLIKTYLSKTYENGIAKFKIDLDPGEYIFKSFCEDNYYKSNYCENTVKIRKSNVIAISQDLHLNRIGEVYKVILKNNETQLPIANQEVIISVNGVSYPCYTDKNGVAGLKINLDENNYTIFYKYKGNNGYNGIEGTNKIIRDHNKLSTNIEVLNNEITRFREEIVAKLSDVNSIPLKNHPMTFSVNGIDYIIYTDENGEAKLPIELYDNEYEFKISYDGNELFKSNEVNFILNVNKKSDFNYSFSISKIKEYDKKYTLWRNIEIIYENGLYQYSTNSGNKGSLLKDHDLYFLSFDYKTSTKMTDTNQIKGQGISINLLDKYIEFTYYGKLSNITLFDVVFDEYVDGLYGKIATIIVNNKIEAKIKFCEYLYFNDDFDEIVSKGYNPFKSGIEDIKTTLNALGFSHNKTLQLDYYNNFKTVQSYLISSSKIESDYVHEYLENYVNSNFNYDVQAQENNLISLYTLWTSQELDEIVSNNLNCSWNEKAVVLTTTEWCGINIHSTSSLNVVGNDTQKFTFKNIHGYLFSYCEQLALEFAGIEAKSSTSEIFEGLINGKLAIFDSNNNITVIKVTNSSSEIVINMTNGDTNCLLAADPNSLINNFKYKGASSENHVSYSYPKDFVQEYNLISFALQSNMNNIFSNETEKGIKRYVFNEIRTHKDKVLASVQSVLLYISPKTGGLIFGTLQVMIYIGEYTLHVRNMYAPPHTYQYFSYHPAIWNGKTIAVLDTTTGYYDYVEIPYKNNGELDIKKATYIEGESGVRNLTTEEVKYYANL